MFKQTATLIATLSLFLATSTARFLQTTPTNTTNATAIAYAANLTCGDCINGGYVFCVKGQEGMRVTTNGTAPTATCCRDGSCAMTSDNTYNCSNSFSDKTYAKFMCPFNTDRCGGQNSFSLPESGQSQSVTIRNLTKGNTCFYNVMTKCGAPQF